MTSHAPGDRRRDVRFLIKCLLTLLVCSALASWVQTDGGRVQVRSFKLPTQNGQWVVADLFKPRSATSKSPAPFVVVVPGFQRSKEALSNVAIELSRRGVVVASIDPYAQGKSSSSMSRQAATREGYGMYAVVDYVAGTDILNYVDKSRIGATGHSAGGNAAINGASYFGREAARTGHPSKLNAVYVSGYVLSLTDKVLKDVRSNVGVAYALYDEGAYRNELKNGDMRVAPEALRLVNSAIADGVSPVERIDIGRYYGEAGTRTLRVVYNEPVIHPLQPYSHEAMANQIEYFERVFALDSGRSSDDQVWQWKELCGLVSLVAAMLMLIPLARILLGTAAFRSLVSEVPAASPKPTNGGRALFWLLFFVGALIACVSYIPLAELSQKIFVAASSREQTWFFPQRMNNAVMMWAVVNGSLGLLMFFASRRFHGRENGAGPNNWGIATSVRELAKTLLLALLLFAFYFAVLFVIYYLLHVDYRFWFAGVRTFQWESLVLLLMYGPFFFVFFMYSSLRTNVAMRFEDQPEWLSMLVAGIGHSLGLLMIVVVQYATYAATGTVYWTDGWLYVNLLFAVVPMIFVLPYFNRLFFRMTGKVYLGPMTTCLVFIMILLTNTVVYVPI